MVTLPVRKEKKRKYGYDSYLQTLLKERLLCVAGECEGERKKSAVVAEVAYYVDLVSNNLQHTHLHLKLTDKNNFNRTTNRCNHCSMVRLIQHRVIDGEENVICATHDKCEVYTRTHTRRHASLHVY